METICIDKLDHQDQPDHPGNPDHLDHLDHFDNLDILHHLNYSDQSNHFDNTDWSMINQGDNCKIRIVYLVLLFVPLRVKDKTGTNKLFDDYPSWQKATYKQKPGKLRDCV